MKRQLLLIPMILAATATIADAQTTAPSAPLDAQAQAAALLSRPDVLRAAKVEAHTSAPVSPAPDAQESAAALLSGARPRNRVSALPAVADANGARISTDAQAQAAALLRGSRSSTVQTKRTDGGERTIGRVRHSASAHL
jgi:hypothetical protein